MTIEKNVSGNFENKRLIVSQESGFGSLGLSALLENGICGPPFDLSDCSVWVENYNEHLEVSFYDMKSSVRKDGKYYQKILDYFKIK